MTMSATGYRDATGELRSTTRNVMGERFGRLVVIDEAPRERQGTGGPRRMWVCRCDCGEVKVVNGHNLLRGLTRSCGCLRIDAGRVVGKSGLGAAARFDLKPEPDRRASADLAGALGYGFKSTPIKRRDNVKGK